MIYHGNPLLRFYFAHMTFQHQFAFKFVFIVIVMIARYIMEAVF